MKLAKLLKFGKKGAKAASGPKAPKKGESAFSWPSGIRIGVYGHRNSGKTTFLTLLKRDCENAADLQLAVRDNFTANHFLDNHRKLYGLAPRRGDGTVLDIREKPKFPDSTANDVVLQMSAVLDKSHKMQVVSLDYPGGAISIAGGHELSEKVIDFMTGCHGLLLMFDPKALLSHTKWGDHVASFVNMIQRLAPLESRLPIPVALVISKADDLPGYGGDEFVRLIRPGDEPILSSNYDVFFERIMSTPDVTRNSEWTSSVRDVLTKTRGLLEVVLGRTLDFQIFFVSSVGNKPKKIGTERDYSIYEPPERIVPKGVRQPVYWLLKSIVRNRRLTVFRRVKKLVRNFVIFWILICSLVFAWHIFGNIYPVTSLEDKKLNQYDGDYSALPNDDAKSIASAYSQYSSKFLPKKVFPSFVSVGRRLNAAYKNLQGSEQPVRGIDDLVEKLVQLIADGDWPTPGLDSLIKPDEYERVQDSMNTISEDSSRAEQQIGSRIVKYLALFESGVANSADTARWASLRNFVTRKLSSPPGDMSAAEKSLCQTFQTTAQARIDEIVEGDNAGKAKSEFDNYANRINSDPDPTFRLETAVSDLEAYKSELDPQASSEELNAVSNYITASESIKKKKTYTLTIQAIPVDCHLHFYVVDDGSSPSFDDKVQRFAGDTFSFEWKPGDDIYIAFDELHVDPNPPETWGKNSADIRILTDKYCIFELDGELQFKNIAKSVQLTLANKPELPVLKK